MTAVALIYELAQTRQTLYPYHFGGIKMEEFTDSKVDFERKVMLSKSSSLISDLQKHSDLVEKILRELKEVVRVITPVDIEERLTFNLGENADSIKPMSNISDTIPEQNFIKDGDDFKTALLNACNQNIDKYSEAYKALSHFFGFDQITREYVFLDPISTYKISSEEA